MRKKLLLILVSVALFSFGLTACGGGGGGGAVGGGGGTGDGGGGQPSAGKGVQVSDMAIDMSEFGLMFASGASASGFDTKMTTKEAIVTFYNAFKERRQKLASIKTKGLKEVQTTQCSGGGTMTVDSTQNGFTITFNNCYMTTDQGKEYLHGRVSYSESGNSFTYSMTGVDGTGKYIYREYEPTKNVPKHEEEWSMNLTGSIQSFSTSCDVPDKYSITIGTADVLVKNDKNRDGKWDENIRIQANNFNESVQITQFNQTCEPTKGIIYISGGLSNTDYIDTNESATISISSGNPLTLTFEDTTSGVRITIDGTVTYGDACFNGTITLTTQTPLLIGEGIDCPSAGVIVVTGGINGRIIYTSTGGVQIDEGNDGTVDHTYPSCFDPEACIGS